MNNMILEDPYETYATRDLPNALTLSASQTEYVIAIIESAMRVVQNSSSLEREEQLLGGGDFFWPKDPAAPTELQKLYGDLRIINMQVQFDRSEKKAPWAKATIMLTPANFPVGSYKIELGAFLDKLELKNTVVESYPDETMHKIRSFKYTLKADEKVHLEFFENADSDDSNFDGKFPRKFYSITINKNTR